MFVWIQTVKIFTCLTNATLFAFWDSGSVSNYILTIGIALKGVEFLLDNGNIANQNIGRRCVYESTIEFPRSKDLCEMCLLGMWDI